MMRRDTNRGIHREHCNKPMVCGVEEGQSVSTTHFVGAEPFHFRTVAMFSIISSIYKSFDDFQFAANNQTITE